MFTRPAIAAMLFVIAAPHISAAQEYVGSGTCTDCHEEAAQAWEGSHHALAWTMPGPDTVIADFNGSSFTHDGMTARFSRDEDRYMVSVTEKDGSLREQPIHSVVGIAPLQQYLLEIEGGRLQSFDVTWDAVKGEWYHLYPDQDLPPDDGLHWTGPYKNWNARCAECHATGFQKNYDAATRTYASVEAEIGVGCEACHGPGSGHIEWATTQTAPAPENYGFSAFFDTAQAEIQQCAGCHSRRTAFGDGNPLPGTPFDDAYELALLRPGLYHADGQIQDEVYVTGSFLQSKMYAKGVSCGNCHEPHTAELKADGNAVCTQCHSPAGNPDFPSLRGAVYDDIEHHFHDPASEGASCTSCHMIERTYMGIDGRRDHSFRVPRPDLAAETGAPDACTDCHSDETPAWAAAEIATRFPNSAHRGPHFGQALAAGRADPVAARGELTSLALDKDQPGIARATALWLLEQSGTEATADAAEPLLADADPLVRAAAIGAQRSAPAQTRVLRLLNSLADPRKNVRIAAAKALLDAPIARLPGNRQAAMSTAMNEWRLSVAARLDFPETHLQLGGTALTLRNTDAARGAFREVVTLDPQNLDAWVMLVRITAATEGRSATNAILAEALTINPDADILHQMLQELRQ
ncbi:tetratricopeptide repeat protein (plasmid) [Rhodobacteraceae bacterium SC52]|nr:tetratricopeptide repeat protein [Rhodobacteraceae bacterium SC52]